MLSAEESLNPISLIVLEILLAGCWTSIQASIAVPSSQGFHNTGNSVQSDVGSNLPTEPC